MLEHHFHQYITNYLNDHHPLSNKQIIWSFQTGKSTVQLSFPSHMTSSKHSKSCTRSVFYFFDLKKTFDFVHHRPLLDKPACYRLDTHTLSWITSYLTNRNQHVVVDGETFSETPILSGKPQGSRLGPLVHTAQYWVHCYSLFTLQCKQGIAMDPKLSPVLRQTK